MCKISLHTYSGINSIKYLYINTLQHLTQEMFILWLTLTLTLLQNPDDGSLKYVSSNNLQNGVGLQMNQNITFTGGTLSVFSDLSRIDQFGSSSLVSRRAMLVASERYQLTMHRFKEGNATVTDLNMAQTENDSALRQYISDVSNFWTYYYSLRQCSLYDFIKGEDLEIDVNEMIN